MFTTQKAKKIKKYTIFMHLKKILHLIKKLKIINAHNNI